MKSKFRIVTAVICAVILTLSLTACNDDSMRTGCLIDKIALLGEPKTVENVEYSALQ